MKWIQVFAESSIAGDIWEQAAEHKPFVLHVYGMSSSAWEDALWVQETQNWVWSDDNWENICGITEVRRKNKWKC